MSLDTPLSVPVRMGNLWYRLFGLLRLESDRVTVEFRTVENVLGLFRSKIRTVDIAFEDITRLEFRRFMLGKAELTIRVASLKTLTRIPGSIQGLLNLKIAARDVKVAKELVHQLELAMSEHQLTLLNPPTLPNPAVED